MRFFRIKINFVSIYQGKIQKEGLVVNKVFFCFFNQFRINETYMSDQTLKWQSVAVEGGSVRGAAGVECGGEWGRGISFPAD